MKHSIWLFSCAVLLFIPFAHQAQHTFQREKRDYIWLFGFGDSNLPPPGFGNTTVDFNYTPPLIIEDDHPMNFEAANASICDAEGNLLFYSNGVYIANYLHQPMENGTGLTFGPFLNAWANGGSRYPQILLALPTSSESTLYRFLYLPIDTLAADNVFGYDVMSFGLYSSTIDMSENDGEGRVVSKNIPVIQDTLDNGKLTAVRHANGRDWWVLAWEDFTNRYYRLLVTPDTILNLGLQAIGDTIPSGLGQAAFSPDGTKYARLNLYLLGGDQYIDLYDFDRCSGMLSNPRHFTYRDTAIVGGLAFSANSKFIYVSSFGYLYQIDADQPDIASSFTRIGYPLTQSYFLNQLTPDGRIFISSGGTSQYLHVINHPNKRGTACGLVQQGVELAFYNFRTMPNHPYYGLGPWDGSPCDTLGIDNPVPVAAFEYTADSTTTGVEFFDGSFFATAWAWDLGDGSTSTARHPVHVYAQGGLYTVCLTASNLTGSHTVCDTVRVEMVSSVGEAQGARVELRIFPNPAQNSFTIAYSLAQPAEMRLYDIHGKMKVSRILPAIQAGREEIPVQLLSSGIYVVVVLTETGERFTTRLSIMR